MSPHPDSWIQGNHGLICGRSALVVSRWPSECVCETAESGFCVGLRTRSDAASGRVARNSGHRSGRSVWFPVVLTEFEEQWYVVSMLGENTNWVPTGDSASHPVIAAGPYCESESA